MSEGQRIDLMNTIQQMKNPTFYTSGLNWLRCRYDTQSAAIDEMCLKGMTELEMVHEINRRGLNKKNKSTESILNRIRQHFKHLTLPLQEDAPHLKSKYTYDIWGHGLPLIQDSEGRWKFDLNKMEQIVGSATGNQKVAASVFYLPTKADIEFAESQLRKSEDEVISIESVLGQVERNFTNDGKLLKDNWRYITQRNIELWFGK